MRRPPLGGSGGRLPVRLGGEEPGLAARLSPAATVCTPRARGATTTSAERVGRSRRAGRRPRMSRWMQGSPTVDHPRPQPRRSSADRVYPGVVGTPPAAAAAFFDLDKTVIARSSTFAFSRPLYQGGLINRRTVLRSAYAHFVFLLAGADHDQMERMRHYLSSMVAGWDVRQVREIVAETLVDLIQPAVYAEAVALIAEHHAAGRDVVVVSASGAELVEPIAALLGADRVVATRMVVEDGRYTGEVEFYAYGETKAAAVRELAGERGYRLEDCYAYSDSITDVPMLAAVGHPVAVN